MNVRFFFFFLISAFLYFFFIFGNVPLSLFLLILLLLLLLTLFIWGYYGNIGWIVSVIFIVIPFDRFRSICGVHISVSEIFLLIAIAAAFINYQLHRNDSSVSHIDKKIVLILLVLWMSFFPSLFNTPNTLKGIKELIRYSELFVCFMVGYAASQRKEYLNSIALASISIGCIQSIWAFFELPLIINDVRKISGSFSHHNSLGIFLIFMLFWGMTVPKKTPWMFFALGSICFGILISFYWAGVISFIVLAGIYLLYHYRKIGIILLANGIILISICFFLFKEPLRPIYSHSAITNRLIIWHDGLSQYVQHPFIGTGVGNYHTTLPETSPAYQYGKNHLHNMYLQVAVEGGACALIPLLCIVFLFIRYWLNNSSLFKKILLNPFFLLSTPVCIFFIAGIFDFLLGHRGICMLFSITMGASSGYRKFNS